MSYFVIFIVGIIIGSFLNVCIYRLPKGKSVIYSSSHCPYCDEKLKFYEIIPIFSYLFLKGRCRYCKEAISSRYPIVELLTGIFFLLSYNAMGLDIMLFKYLFFFSVLIVIAFIDIEYQIIPNELVFVVFIWGIIWQLFYPRIYWTNALIGAVFAGGLLLAIAVISRGGMGGGDIKLMFAAGFYLGMPLTALAFFISFLTGGIVGVALIVLKKKRRKEPIAFGPFLALGIFIAIIWGEMLIGSYLKSIGM